MDTTDKAAVQKELARIEENWKRKGSTAVPYLCKLVFAEVNSRERLRGWFLPF